MAVQLVSFVGGNDVTWLRSIDFCAAPDAVAPQGWSAAAATCR